MSSPGAGSDDPNVVPLAATPGPPEPPRVPSRPGRVHGMAIGGMLVFAVLGIVSMLAFITVRWPGDLGRYVMTAFVGSGFGFVFCAIMAVFAAARDTYPQGSARRSDAGTED